ncbi:MAG: MBL fold metallo-hydrolase [Chloroflexi bacterium]|nr:MBL fold metallo-hydrolase [Chloroflexota bacterium]
MANKEPFVEDDLRVETVVVGMLQANCYLAGCPKTNECLVIDPGDDVDLVLQRMKDLGWQARLIVATHGHFDHVLAANELKRLTGAPLAAHKLDVELLRQPGAALGMPGLSGAEAGGELDDGDEIELGEHAFRVLHTPGHTPGGICLLSGGVLFSGDTLFNTGVGRTDFPGGSWDELMESIHDRLFELPPETKVYPGHGPATTIGYEKMNNPFV